MYKDIIYIKMDEININEEYKSENENNNKKICI